MNNRLELLQVVYALQPYAAYIRTSTFHATFRFSTLKEAIKYLQDQYVHTAEICKHTQYVAFDARRSGIVLQNGTTVACSEFIGDSLSSY